MIIKVHLIAFVDHDVRNVDIGQPVDMSTNGILNQTFYWGQNDFQPQQHVSVSAGDVIELNDGRLFLIKAIGFKELSKEQFDSFTAIPRRERELAQDVWDQD